MAYYPSSKKLQTRDMLCNMSEKRKIQKRLNAKHIMIKPQKRISGRKVVRLNDLITDIAIRSGLEFSQVKKAVPAIVQAMKNSLAKHEKVTIDGFFEFRPKFVSGTQCCRNPMTGEKLVPKDYYRIRFYPSPKFVEMVDNDDIDNKFINLKELKKELKLENAEKRNNNKSVIEDPQQ